MLSQQLVRLARRPFEQGVELAVGHRQAGAVVEIVQVQVEGTVRFEVDDMIQDLLCVTRRSVWRETHQLVLARVHFESGVISECRIQQAQRVREVDFFDDLKMISASEAHGCGGPFADAVHGEDQRFVKWRRIESAGGVALVMLGKQKPVHPVEFTQAL